MQPQSVKEPGMLAMQLGQGRPLGRGDGRHDPAPHPSGTAARQYLGQVGGILALIQMDMGIGQHILLAHLLLAMLQIILRVNHARP